MEATVTYTHARQNLKKVFDTVCSSRVPMRVERKTGGNIVMIAEDDFDSIIETLYLLRSSKNAEHLKTSLEQANAGETTILDLKTLENDITNNN